MTGYPDRAPWCANMWSSAEVDGHLKESAKRQPMSLQENRKHVLSQPLRRRQDVTNYPETQSNTGTGVCPPGNTVGEGSGDF